MLRWQPAAKSAEPGKEELEVEWSKADAAVEEDSRELATETAQRPTSAATADGQCE